MAKIPKNLKNFIVKNGRGMFFGGLRNGGNPYWTYNRSEAKYYTSEKCMDRVVEYYPNPDDPMRQIEKIYI